MSALKKPEIKLTAADRRKLEKAMALVAEVITERFGAASANQMGSDGLRVWQRITSAQQALSSSLRG